ncbi:hypothetical protein LINPERPRIM_LOCUS15531 [Linum perenne]
MIKISAKPISSPGRAEKYYPPPLMRFLRSNVGSKSRGRSRSSPMFVRKKNTAAIEAPEPSSPKVTCMGQVRVRRSGKKKRRSSSDCSRCRCRCRWIQSVLFCHGCCCRVRRRKPPPAPAAATACCSVRPDWRKWRRFFCCSKKSKPKVGEDRETDFGSSLGRRREVEVEDSYGDELVEEEDDGEEPASSAAARKMFACSSTENSPPKNALLLIRSRSAPYRTSSLASRFWGSPVGSEETEQKQSTEQEDSTSVTSKRESSSSSSEESDKESRLDPETEEIIKLGHFKDFECSVELIEEKIKEATDPELGELEAAEEVVERRPVLLTRCKSEPARIGGEKFDEEVSFWKKRRLGFT